MPGYLICLGDPVLCMHGGIGQTIPTNLRVKVNGKPIVLQNNVYAIAGCSLLTSGGPFCATAQWTRTATRVKSNGVPVILQDSQAECQTTKNGVLLQPTQLRIKGI
ncbi:hypothetical protein [Leptolyngbya sp. GGD]|uniref:hypothetical protein n=1 Tax=Leptolyngbya sp. GGD TaxID=2997907 RepID=UPI00227BC296|nr:hypothetical protein [Leptolyngbya sp. GGD]MCY6493363.1 hypothetical protein [Leptolyngbya sp. GGD]